ncbi:dihydroneopterin aldolase [Helicobacter sp. MIT 14-3879]|uniref:dihydroneopterin aldolase n=1 Tax=Helicobacter sp. MIT 14-3879 TaxID=2040649 RepID=UPI0015F1A119|nr:dihydroneopterin aldolase [Helicobacter sp. MIT 14-3879]
MTLKIQSLHVQTIIGILPHERKNLQPTILNAKIQYRYRGEFLDYILVRDFMTQILCRGEYGLLESALRDIAFRLFDRFDSIKKITLEISKPNINTQCQISLKATFKKKSKLHRI